MLYIRAEQLLDFENSWLQIYVKMVHEEEEFCVIFAFVTIAKLLECVLKFRTDNLDIFKDKTDFLRNVSYLVFCSNL